MRCKAVLLSLFVTVNVAAAGSVHASPVPQFDSRDDPPAGWSVGPYERNRVWRVVNNGCRTPDGMFPPATEFEINMCLTVHRGTGYADRRQALLNLRRIGAVRFYDFQIEALVRATERARPGYFERVVRMVAAPTRLGQFILELCEDHERIRLILTSQPVPLE